MKQIKAEPALSVVCPGNVYISDCAGRDSIMVKIPKQTYAQLGLGGSTEVHPAFVVNGRELDAIYISKYENVLEDGLAYSLPARNPSAGIDFDDASKACTSKGLGWHLMTKTEWALLAQWCLNNHTLPLGNCSLGRDLQETGYKGHPATWKDGQVNCVLTGTGPLTWSHDRTPSGVWDLKGNLGEWVCGARTVFGELQILPNNDAADSRNLQTADSPAWRAIDASTGGLLAPDGTGTTLNSLKLELADGKWRWVSAREITRSDKFYGCAYEDVTCDGTVKEPARQMLQTLGFYRHSQEAGAYQGAFFYAHSGADERFFGCGGHFRHGTEAGIFCTHGTTGRKDTSPTRGFRSAYIPLDELV